MLVGRSSFNRWNSVGLQPEVSSPRHRVVGWRQPFWGNIFHHLRCPTWPTWPTGPLRVGGVTEWQVASIVRVCQGHHGTLQMSLNLSNNAEPHRQCQIHKKWRCHRKIVQVWIIRHVWCFMRPGKALKPSATVLFVRPASMKVFLTTTFSVPGAEHLGTTYWCRQWEDEIGALACGSVPLKLCRLPQASSSFSS